MILVSQMKKRCQNFINKILRTMELTVEARKIYNIGIDQELERSKKLKHKINEDGIYYQMIKGVDERIAEKGWYQTYKQSECKEEFVSDISKSLWKFAEDLNFVSIENDTHFVEQTEEIWIEIVESLSGWGE